MTDVLKPAEDTIRGLVARGRPLTNAQLWGALRSKSVPETAIDEVRSIAFKLGCAYGVFTDGGVKHRLPI